MSPKDIVGLLQYMTGGLVLGIVLWAIMKGYLVTGKTYNKVEAECDEYKQRYFAKVDPEYKSVTKS